MKPRNDMCTLLQFEIMYLNGDSIMEIVRLIAMA